MADSIVLSNCHVGISLVVTLLFYKYDQYVQLETLLDQ